MDLADDLGGIFHADRPPEASTYYKSLIDGVKSVESIRTTCMARADTPRAQGGGPSKAHTEPYRTD